MKILFVISTPIEYSSSGNMRNIALINGLTKLGNEVHLLTSEADKNNTLYDDSLLNSTIKKRYYIPLGNMHKKISYINNRNKIMLITKQYIYKILSKLSIYDPRKNLVNKLESIKIEEEFDLMISSSDPKSSHLIAERLIKNNVKICKKWLQYWGDPFAGDINKQSILPSILIRKEEERLMALANLIVYVSPFTLKEQTLKFEKYKNKMFFTPVPYVSPIEYKETQNVKFKVGYFGDYFFKDRNITPLYNALKKMRNTSELIVYGETDIVLNCEENISINRREKRSSISKLEGECDLLICILNKKGTQIPGKIYHYAATNKPILVLLDGEYREEMRHYLESFNRYIICNNTADEILEAIQNIIISSKDYNPSVHFSPIKIAEDILKLYFNK